MGYAYSNRWTNELIAENIYKVMNILNITRMPTSKEVRLVKIPGLDAAISNSGGYIYWAKKLNLERKEVVKNKRLIQQHPNMTEDEIQQKLWNIIKKLNINRMPSRSEIISVEKDNKLHNAIVRGLGYFKWAEKLGLEMKDSETLMGISYQDICIKQLNDMGYKAERTTTNAPYDVIVNDNIRIDVKSSHAYYIKKSRVHTFAINKKFPTCDLYVLYALAEEGNEIERMFVIPSKYLKLISVSIGTNSKYNKYINRWDYIDIYDNFYKQLI